jgi:hypothetical protein
MSFKTLNTIHKEKTLKNKKDAGDFSPTSKSIEPIRTE